MTSSQGVHLFLFFFFYPPLPLLLCLHPDRSTGASVRHANVSSLQKYTLHATSKCVTFKAASNIIRIRDVPDRRYEYEYFNRLLESESESASNISHISRKALQPATTVCMMWDDIQAKTLDIHVKDTAIKTFTFHPASWKRVCAYPALTCHSHS